MKCELVGVQNVDFKADDGNEVKGVKLHVVSLDQESSSYFQGRRVATIFYTGSMDGIKLGKVELKYSVPFGGGKSRLVGISNI